MDMVFENRVETRQEHRHRQYKAFALDSATKLQVDADLRRLLAEGAIVFDFMPEDDDLPLEDAEQLFDAEWDLSDEDAPPPRDFAGDPSDNDPYFPSDDFYRLPVVNGLDGIARCLPPSNGWVGATGLTHSGRDALQHVSTRMAVLGMVAAWLTRHPRVRNRLQNGPEGFLAGWKPLPQDDFLKQCDWPGKSGKAGIKEKGTFSKFIRNANLSWPQGSIPLHGGVFAARG